MARVNLDEIAFGDWRIARLGQLLGTSRFDALGRLAFVWRECLVRQVFSLAPPTVDAIADRSGFVESMIEADLAERLEDGSVRVKGLAGRIEWLGRLREGGRKGGLAVHRSQAQAGLELGSREAQAGLTPPSPAPSPAPSPEAKTKSASPGAPPSADSPDRRKAESRKPRETFESTVPVVTENDSAFLDEIAKAFPAFTATEIEAILDAQEAIYVEKVRARVPGFPRTHHGVREWILHWIGNEAKQRAARAGGDS
jgi:hypothetical protein